jgi:hypothetical protein
VLAWHVADDDGEPVERSAFVDEVDRPARRRAR